MILCIYDSRVLQVHATEPQAWEWLNFNSDRLEDVGEALYKNCRVMGK